MSGLELILASTQILPISSKKKTYIQVGNHSPEKWGGLDYVSQNGWIPP